jgi:hypothetical protein
MKWNKSSKSILVDLQENMIVDNLIHGFDTCFNNVRAVLYFFGNVRTVWYFLEMFGQCGIFWKCSDSVVFFCFAFHFVTQLVLVLNI